MNGPDQPTTPASSAGPAQSSPAQSDPAQSDWDSQAVATALRECKVRGVRLWLSAPEAEVLTDGCAKAGWRCIELDTSGVSAKRDYIATCADQVPLPAYLGRNWDALEESLGDLGVDAANNGDNGLLVVWRNWAGFAAAEPGSFQVALAIWRSVSSDWRERLDGAAVVLAVDTSQVPSPLPESVTDEITGISRVRTH